MSNIDLLKKIWESLYDPKKEVSVVVNQHFHPDYSQCINGVEMGFDDYISHVVEQKSNMFVTQIEYKHFIEKDDALFALYYPKGVNYQGVHIKAEVIAYFKFKEQKLSRIQGQVRLIEGSLADVDM